MNKLSDYIAFTNPFLPDFNDVEKSLLVCDSVSLEWYKKLSIHQRINFKDCFKLACGVEFQELNFMLSLRERINLLYSKLTKEGIIK